MRILKSFIAVTALLFSIVSLQSKFIYNTNLTSYADSFNVETDYLNVPNYYYTPELNEDNIIGYSYESIIPTENYEILESGIAKYSDASFGISVIEILAHNKLISVNDISSGVSLLNEINDSENVRKIISSYQNILDNKEFKILINYYFKSISASEKIPYLVSTAENAMNKGKYFLIMYGSYNANPTILEESLGFTKGSRVQKVHSAVGTGIENGLWEFNGKKYNERILTLDSINVDDNNGAFSEETCIYINSETNEFYVPKYSDYVESELHIVAIEDDKLTGSDIGVNNIINLTLTNKNTTCDYTITANSENKTEILNNDNDYLDYYHNPYNGNFYIKADSLKIDRKSHSNIDYITLTDLSSFSEIELKNSDSIIEYSPNNYRIIRTFNSENKKYSEDSALYYNFSFNRNNNLMWSFYGETITDIYFNFVTNGIIIKSSDNEIKTTVSVENVTDVKIYSCKELLVSLNENDDIAFFIDEDNDGFYESKIENGDVNCDGNVDASDASAILSAYSDLSTGKNTYLNDSLADFNNDGMIDASDASDVLAEYARLSTT